ncbi:MAG: hypothetical protein VXY17_01560 [Verrucomicrobiota bacterium]|nr:hypothetical protein [Verrucomicrobiota bacterium]
MLWLSADGFEGGRVCIVELAVNEVGARKEIPDFGAVVGNTDCCPILANCGFKIAVKRGGLGVCYELFDRLWATAWREGYGCGLSV